MLGVFVIWGGTPYLANLEYIDSKSLTRSQREEQDLHLVGAGKAGSRINAIEQALIL